MPDDEDRLIELDVRAAGAPELDEISSGTPWPRRRRFLIAAALVIVALASYYAATGGAQPEAGRKGATSPLPTTRLLVQGPGQPPTVTNVRCSNQIGGALQLGLQIANLSATDATLLGADVELPLGGLRLTAIAWGVCGQSTVRDGASPYLLPSGATVWLRMTFDVLVGCPAPLPVEVNLRYVKAETVAVTSVGGFSDLGGVPYTGCSASPG
jgi:hypothetical protein